jgi:hypothetical protein
VAPAGGRLRRHVGPLACGSLRRKPDGGRLRRHVGPLACGSLRRKCGLCGSRRVRCASEDGNPRGPHQPRLRNSSPSKSPELRHSSM